VPFGVGSRSEKEDRATNGERHEQQGDERKDDPTPGGRWVPSSPLIELVPERQRMRRVLKPSLLMRVKERGAIV
jgi:hypothetical protein